MERKTVFISPAIVPYRRPKGDLDGRYNSQAYTMVSEWVGYCQASKYEILPDNAAKPVQLHYRSKGLRFQLLLVADGFPQEGAIPTDIYLLPGMPLYDAMLNMQLGWQSIPELNP
ncbi:hypothetical protein EDF88_4552 [Buttiauxella sp. BIGb0552]|jgi:hypothetical protein|uniref:Uncharacterized protein n=2 Tax=Buttiauxella TaxID=82976 RepID=A0A381KND2_9ENTR|nr:MULTISPECIES: hypothetical protein [Buttiauxella]TDX11954.1 hypothetical protein EDF88_4552 [Buttiauxella sp. BIGb0552]SUY92884.1 Uncharacterised protein [Buttiauxella agrestis]